MNDIQKTPILEPLADSANQSVRVFSWDADLADVKIELNAGEVKRYQGFGNNWHYHPELELNLMLEGKGLLFVGDHVGQFKAPDAVLLGSSLPHYWRATGKVKGIAVQWSVMPSSPIAKLAELQDLMTVFSLSERGLRYQGETLRLIEQQLKATLASTSLLRLSKVLELFEILRQSPSSDSSLLSERVISLTHKSNKMSEVITYLTDHYQRAINLTEVLELSQMSRATFHRQFKKTTGSTLGQYLNAIRLQEAKRLVLETDMSITTIAYDTGFYSLSHFNALFKRRFALSPRELRKEAH